MKDEAATPTTKTLNIEQTLNARANRYLASTSCLMVNGNESVVTIQLQLSSFPKPVKTKVPQYKPINIEKIGKKNVGLANPLSVGKIIRIK